VNHDVYGYDTFLRDKVMQFPLTSAMNSIEALRMESLRIGYKSLLSVDTLGDAYHTLVVEPDFYWFDGRTATPVDVYVESGYGSYALANSFYGEDISHEVHFNLDWNNEQLRRNVSDADNARTQAIARREGEAYPKGAYYDLGTLNALVLGEGARTHFASDKTRGVSQSLGEFAASEFENGGKRWHFTYGLPSSAVFVDAGASPTANNLAKYKGADGYVLMALTVYAVGDAFVLEYGAGTSAASLIIDGETYPLPPGLPPIVAVYDGGKSSRGDLTIVGTH
jgi:hypothetical protein